MSRSRKKITANALHTSKPDRKLAVATATSNKPLSPRRQVRDVERVPPSSLALLVSRQLTNIEEPQEFAAFVPGLITELERREFRGLRFIVLQITTAR
ncbi:hypothetical protein LTR16_011430, partial [Cryomyces antarcticus]